MKGFGGYRVQGVKGFGGYRDSEGGSEGIRRVQGVKGFGGYRE